MITFAAGRHDEIVAGDSSRSRGAGGLEQRSGTHRGRKALAGEEWRAEQQSSKAKGEVEEKGEKAKYRQIQ